MSAILASTELALPQLPPGWQLVEVAALANHKLALLATNVDLANEWRRDSSGAVLGKPFEMAARAKGRLWCFDSEGLVEGPTFNLETPVPAIDRFDDGRWLVAARRTGSEPNARVLTPDGQLQARFMLGDGIQHVGVDRRGQIWVGWFDEGVYGNDEWRVPDQEWPPSGAGVGLFSADGSRQELPALPRIDDCYALNVLDQSAWACTHTDFPLLQLRPGCPPRWWSNELNGSTALAVSAGHVLLAGRYGADANRLALVTLDEEGNGGSAQIAATWRLPLAPRTPQRDGHSGDAARRPWQQPRLLAGRGDTIHLVQNETWHCWRVSDALIASRASRSRDD